MILGLRADFFWGRGYYYIWFWACVEYPLWSLFHDIHFLGMAFWLTSQSHQRIPKCDLEWWSTCKSPWRCSAPCMVTVLIPASQSLCGNSGIWLRKMGIPSGALSSCRSPCRCRGPSRRPCPSGHCGHFAQTGRCNRAEWRSEDKHGHAWRSPADAAVPAWSWWPSWDSDHFAQAWGSGCAEWRSQASHAIFPGIPADSAVLAWRPWPSWNCKHIVQTRRYNISEFVQCACNSKMAMVAMQYSHAAEGRSPAGHQLTRLVFGNSAVAAWWTCSSRHRSHFAETRGSGCAKWGSQAGH